MAIVPTIVPAAGSKYYFAELTAAGLMQLTEATLIDSDTLGPPASEWFEGHGPPADDTMGRDGDFFLDVDTGDVYEMAGGTWGGADAPVTPRSVYTYAWSQPDGNSNRLQMNFTTVGASGKALTEYLFSLAGGDLQADQTYTISEGAGTQADFDYATFTSHFAGTATFWIEQHFSDGTKERNTLTITGTGSGLPTYTSTITQPT